MTTEREMAGERDVLADPRTEQGRWLLAHQGLINIGRLDGPMRGDEIDLRQSILTIEAEAASLSKSAPDRPDPLSIRCPEPYCAAEPGQPCPVPASIPAHAARLFAATAPPAEPATAHVHLLATQDRVGLRGDGPCADCGTNETIVWFTDNAFWNAVTGENVVHEESRGAILCVPCFVARADDAGYRPTGWRLLPEWPWRERTP